jgi:DNA-binding CsgD family transcriptional regulator
MSLERLALDPPLSPMQTVCVTLLALGKGFVEIGDLLHISPATVAMHIKVAANKMPGDLPHRLRVIAWARGATIDVMTGHQLKAIVMDEARAAPLLPMLPQLPELVGSGAGSND